MNALTVYQILYSFMACDGRQERLFGDSARFASEAFVRSLVGEAFPVHWFELPLKGDPWFELHVLHRWKDVQGADAAYSGQAGVYADVLEWFKGCPAGVVRQLALSYDSSSGNADAPAVQVLRRDAGVDTPVAFLEAVGRTDLTDG